MNEILLINGQEMQIKNNVIIKEKKNGQVKTYRFKKELDRF